MAEDVSVVFGANIAGLIAGVAEAKENIEGLRAPVDDFVASLSGIAEVIGLAFAAEKIREFATEMAELGERTLNTAYILAQSVGDYAQLSGAFVLLGGDADGAQRTFERLALSVQRVSEGNKTAIAAFHNLGISTEEVNAKGNDLTGLLTLLITRYAELDPKLQNIGVLHQIAGRGVDRLAAALRAGGEGWQEALKGAEDYRRSVEENAAAEADSAEKQNALKLALMTLANDGFGLIKPVVDAIVGAMVDFVNGLDHAIGPIGDVKREMSGWEVAFRVVIQTIKDIIDILGLFGDVLQHLMVESRTFGEQLHEIFIGIKDMIIATLTGGSIEDAYDQMMGRLSAITTSRGNELVTIWGDIVSRINNILGTAAPDVTLPDVGVTAKRGGRALGTESAGGGRKKKTKAEDMEDQDFSGAATGLIQREVEALNAQQKQQDEVFRRYSDAIKNRKALGQINATEEAQEELKLTELKWQYDQAYFEKKIAAAQGDEKLLQRLTEQEAEAYQKYLTQVQQNTAQVQIQSQAAWTQISDQIKSQMGTAVTSVVQGTQSMGQAFKKLVLEIISDFEQIAVKKVLDSLFSQLTSGMSGLFGGAGGASGFLGGAGGASGFLGGAGGASGFLGGLPLIGSLFGAGGTAATLSSGTSALDALAPMLLAASHGGIVPSAAGGWMVPSFQGGGILSMLHSGEMVLPADISQGMQSMIRGGGAGGGTININAIDTQTGSQFLMRNRNTVGQAFRNASLTGGLSYRQIANGRGNSGTF